MQVVINAMFFAAVVLAAPAPDMVARRDAILARGTAAIDAAVFDQGNGYYMAVYNDTIAALDVTFVPTVEPDAFTGPMPVSTRNTHDSAGLTKRATECSGIFSRDTPTLDRANIQLARNVDKQVYGLGQWGWVCTRSFLG